MIGAVVFGFVGSPFDEVVWSATEEVADFFDIPKVEVVHFGVGVLGCNTGGEAVLGKKGKWTGNASNFEEAGEVVL